MNTIDKITALFSAIVGVGMATVIVSSPNTSGIIRAGGEAFQGSLRTAMGR